MQGRKNWLGYLAIGLGLVALMISLGGHLVGGRGMMERGATFGPRMGQQGRSQQGQEQGSAQQGQPAQGSQQGSAQQGSQQGSAQQGTVPQAGPNTPQGQFGQRGRSERGDTDGAGAMLNGREGRRGEGLLGGILPLIGGLLIAGLGLRLFMGGRRRGGPGGGHAAHSEQAWQEAASKHGPAANVQQAAPAATPVAQQPAPTSAQPTPPAAGHTGETTRLYDF